MAVLQANCILENACYPLETRRKFVSLTAWSCGSRRYGDIFLLACRKPPARSARLLLIGEPSWTRKRRRRREEVCRCSSAGDDDALVAAAIYEVEVMVREPQEVLEGMRERLSTQDLQLMLLYFSQEGRDAWYALEVFEWMQGAGRAGDDTRDLMMSIMFKWLMDVVGTGGSLEDVKSLLQDMACVGLQPEPDILQALACAYWDRGSKEDALELALYHFSDDDQTTLAALMWRMTHSNNQRQAMELVTHVRNSHGSKVSFRIYNVALLAAISEQQQLTRTLRELGAYQKRGMVGQLEDADKAAIQEYERSLHEQAEQIAGWALEEHHPDAAAAVHQKLLTMYCVAGLGLEAMRALWRLKLTGKTIHARLFNVVLGICAYGNHQHATRLILNTMKADGPVPDKKSYSALFGGFMNGGHVEEAIDAFLEMLDQGFLPEKNTVLAVMKQIGKTNNISLVYKLGQRLVQAELVEPFVIYLYIDRLNLSIIILL